MKSESKKIELFVSDKSVKIKAGKILKRFTDRSYDELLKAVENSEPLYTTELIPERMYDGIEIVVTVINNLESATIPYTLFINGKLESKKAILKIKYKVDSINFKDFR